jgi:hypothetical protein
MDPYLEARNRWRGFHLLLLGQMAADLQPQLIPRYVASLEERLIIGPPEQEIWPDIQIRERDDVTGGVAVASRVSTAEVTIPERIVAPDLRVPHRFINIRHVESKEVVSVIELFSPWNKVGQGREEYQRKQRQLLLSDANLIEIDLLRRGPHTVAVPKALLGTSDYRICIHRGAADAFEVIRLGIRQPLPSFPIPLRAEDPDVVLHLGQAFAGAYTAGAYPFVLSYDQMPEVPLSAEDAEWARERIEAWRAEQATSDR